MIQCFSRFAMIFAVSMLCVGVMPAGSAFGQDADGEHQEKDSEKVEAEGEPADGDGHDKDEPKDGKEHPEGEHAEKHGADGHGDGHDLPPLLSYDVGAAVCNLAIFLLVFAILAKFVWPHVLSGLQAREDKIRSDLEDAEKANADATKLLSEYQSKLDEASSQVQSMLAQARTDAEANGQRIVDEAKAEAARQAERAIADIETAKKVAMADLAGQTSDMAIGVAKQIVGRELQAGDHQDLIRKSLDSLPSQN